jgi:hypothetical protein
MDFSKAQFKLHALDKSPMDISYYPTSYPLLKIRDMVTDPMPARVIYSRPQKNGRVIFGDLIEYGKAWCLGVNEASEIEFYQNVRIGNTKIKKGCYTLYAIPFIDKWTILFNTESLIRPLDKNTEGFSHLVFWDNIKTSSPISL